MALLCNRIDWIRNQHHCETRLHHKILTMYELCTHKLMNLRSMNAINDIKKSVLSFRQNWLSKNLVTKARVPRLGQWTITNLKVVLLIRFVAMYHRSNISNCNSVVSILKLAGTDNCLRFCLESCPSLGVFHFTNCTSRIYKTFKCFLKFMLISENSNRLFQYIRLQR